MTEFVIPAAEIHLEPQNGESGAGTKSFAWMKSHSPWMTTVANVGVPLQIFDTSRFGHHFFMLLAILPLSTGSDVVRVGNFHMTVIDPTHYADGVSPIALDVFNPGSGHPAEGGGDAEVTWESSHQPKSYLPLVRNEWNYLAMELVLDASGAGMHRVWVVNSQRQGVAADTPVIDRHNLSTLDDPNRWPDFWMGAYNSGGVSSRQTVSIAIARIGRSWAEAHNDQPAPVPEAYAHSTSTGGGSADSSINPIAGIPVSAFQLPPSIVAMIGGGPAPVPTPPPSADDLALLYAVEANLKATSLIYATWKRRDDAGAYGDPAQAAASTKWGAGLAAYETLKANLQASPYNLALLEGFVGNAEQATVLYSVWLSRYRAGKYGTWAQTASTTRWGAAIEAKNQLESIFKG